ncbi:hypothetical protein [Gordonia hydrophobica]|uniref:N-acetyltransferase domain-containing protein n=1 Tax=Gordonia hydrophobica TaxID=40516 RepID=A0ABZ2U0I4_9ACTN|nr:hypothetical protein [Gordonia hydrophobica]MBM7367774.1 GNAT superfamily N-acetyltransferase [Gordonia hydrophobica]
MSHRRDDIEIRPLKESEVDSAVDLVAGSMSEIPLFAWLLGAHIDDDEVRRWLASFFIAPHVARGGVEAAVPPTGPVGGILIWLTPDRADAPLPPSIQALSARILTSRTDIVDRLKTLRAVLADERRPGDYVDVLLSVVAPEFRGIGVPGRLVMRARTAAADAGLGITLSTTDAALGEAYERTHGAVLQKAYPIGPLTNYSYLISPE